MSNRGIERLFKYMIFSALALVGAIFAFALECIINDVPAIIKQTHQIEQHQQKVSLDCTVYSAERACDYRPDPRAIDHGVEHTNPHLPPVGKA